MMSELITDDPDNQELADELCLLAYLQHHQDRLLLCDASLSAGVSQIVHTIERMFDQLKTKNVGFLSRAIFGDRIYFTKKECNTSYYKICKVIKTL